MQIIAFKPHTCALAGTPYIHPFFEKNKLRLGETKWLRALTLSPENTILAHTSPLKDYIHINHILNIERGTHNAKLKIWSLSLTLSQSLVRGRKSSGNDINTLNTDEEKTKQNRESSRKAENMRKNQKWSKSDLADKKVAILCFKMEIKLYIRVTSTKH